MLKLSPKRTFLLFLALFWPMLAWPGCEIVNGGHREPFDGKTLVHLLVEKKSLVVLNELYPALNVIEKTFKGEVLTCSSCTERHIVCPRAR